MKLSLFHKYVFFSQFDDTIMKRKTNQRITKMTDTKSERKTLSAAAKNI